MLRRKVTQAIKTTNINQAKKTANINQAKKTTNINQAKKTTNISKFLAVILTFICFQNPSSYEAS